jgi:hypothetical protein
MTTRNTDLPRLVGGPPREGQFVYGGDQTFEQAWPDIHAARIFKAIQKAFDGNKVPLCKELRRSEEPNDLLLADFIEHCGTAKKLPTFQERVATLTIRRARRTLEQWRERNGGEPLPRGSIDRAIKEADEYLAWWAEDVGLEQYDERLSVLKVERDIHGRPKPIDRSKIKNAVRRGQARESDRRTVGRARPRPRNGST